MKYTVILEEASGKFNAIAPDFPGCVATGVTGKEAVENIQIALKFYVDDLVSKGKPIPKPSCAPAFCELAVA
jgi:predicted RNase H-like HicB family nuclease